MSQLDNDLGRVSGAMAPSADHDPWPAATHGKKNKVHSGHHNRRQSVLAPNELHLSEESHFETAPHHEGHVHKRERRRSSTTARRGSLLPAELAPESSPKRKQSLLPVLRAVTKGEEVTVISGMKSVESGIGADKSSLSAKASTVAQRDGESGEYEKGIGRKTSKNDNMLSTSIANMRRRSTTSVKEGLISEVSQEFSHSGKLEDQINLQHLVELMTVFNEADENGSDGLDIDEFKAAFGQILGKGKNDQQMAIMFMKIDTNCDGTVDWDEFCTYMLLEYQEKEVMAGEKLAPFPYPLRIMHNPRPVHEMITGIGFLPSLHRHSHSSGSHSSSSEGEEADSHSSSSVMSHDNGMSGDGIDGRYISVCRDGSLFFWKSNLTLQKVISLEEGKASKLTWVTSLAIMPNINKLMLSFTDNMLGLYDLSSASCDRLLQIVSLSYCVIAMDYWFDPKDYNRAILVMGDSGGGVSVIDFSAASSHLFGLQLGIHDNHRIPFPELIYHKHDTVKVTYIPKIHDDWISQVKYCPVIGYTMSCSNDSTCSLNLMDRQGLKESTVLKVRKGISSFDYCKEWNIIATGGLDRVLRYWNPYMPGKPIAVLKGHSTAILKVAIDSRHGHVLSLSKDMELKVWNIQDQQCVQNCHRLQPLRPHLPTAFFHHPNTGVLLVGTNQLGVLEPGMNDEQLGGRGEVVSHEKPLCAALYNENFNQVVSGCHGSVVSVWDVDTGEKTIQFSHCHGNMEITAMAFDTVGRRLITGGRDGTLKIWNFNNGACLSVLQTRYSVEVTCISFMKGRVIVGGWSRCITEYSDHRDPDDVIPKYWGEDVHKEDILCMSSQEPNVLASASYDGDIIIWNVDVERSMCKLNASNEKSRGEHWKGVECESSECLSRSRHSRRHLDKATSSGHGSSRGKLRSSSSRKRGRPQSSISISKEHAIEMIAFLQTRPMDLDSASLIACGTGGWIQMWNISGGGLIGEFNVWDNPRHRIDGEERQLRSVTALKLDSNDELLITGNSIGYLQLWEMDGYCYKVPSEMKPVKDSPPLSLAWRAHLSSIVSIDLAEDKGLIITASTDCCVRMFTLNGRYIGTFGEKSPWQLSYPIKLGNLPRKAPPRLNKRASFRTIQTVSGPITSKWKLAKNLFRMLLQAKRKQAALDLFGIGADMASWVTSESTTSSSILGRHYQRRSRFREPIVPTRLKQCDGRFQGIYSALKCSDIQEPDGCSPPSSVGGGGRGHSVVYGLINSEQLPSIPRHMSERPLPRNPHTESSLLPPLVNARKVTITG